MIVHVAFEVADLARSARFYDAVFHALGARRTFESERAVAYGRDHEQFWIVDRGRPPAPGYGHVALAAAGRAAVVAGYEAGLNERRARRRRAGDAAAVRADVLRRLPARPRRVAAGARRGRALSLSRPHMLDR